MSTPERPIRISHTKRAKLMMAALDTANQTHPPTITREWLIGSLDKMCLAVIAVEADSAALRARVAELEHAATMRQWTDRELAMQSLLYRTQELACSDAALSEETDRFMATMDPKGSGPADEDMGKVGR